MYSHPLAQIEHEAPLACSLTSGELAARATTVDELVAAAAISSPLS